MVTVLYGRAGCGKTRELFSRAKALDKSGVSVCLVVPEQLSITREYAFSAAGLKNANVFSFSRLANTVFRECGGAAKKLPDRVAASAAVYRAVINVAKKLEYYRRVAFNRGFISKLMSAFDEFDSCRMSLEKIIAKTGGKLPANTEKKYRDLFTIYGEYKRLWNEEYRAPGDELTQAAHALEKNAIFEGCVFMFDGFYGFTEQQRLLISRIIEQSAGCFFAFTTDLESELFTTVTGEVGLIEKMCGDLGERISFVPVRNEKARIQSPALRDVERELFSSDAKSCGQSDGVTVYSALNINDELSYIACKIKNDVLCGRYRYRDIAILTQNGDGISTVVSTVFKKHGVPVFTDDRKSLLSSPLMAFVLAALDTVRNGYNAESVFSLLKTGLSGISQDDVSLIEKYVKMWSIRGGMWTRERWTQNPFGLNVREKDTEKAAERLEHINVLRDRFMRPLSAFSKKMKKASNCRDMLAAVCELLEDFSVYAILNERADLFEKMNDGHLADEYRRVYGLFTDMLDGIDSVMGDARIGLNELCGLMRACAGNVVVTDRPARADEVIFSSLGRVRAENIKCVYIARMNGEYIPAPLADNGLITDADKRLFNKCGILTSMDFVRSAAREKFDFYSAVTCASDELVLSYSRNEITGDGMNKSEYLKQIEKICGADEITSDMLPPEFYMVSISSAAALASTGRYEGLSDAVFELGGVLPPPENRMEKLSDAVVSGMFSKNLRLSFSSTEEYVSCPFRYFVSHILRADENRPAQLDPANVGTFLHAGLERLLSGGCDYDEDGLFDAVERISLDYYDSVLADCKGSSARQDRMFERAKGAFHSAAKSVMREIRESGFVPYGFEINLADAVPQIPLENGRTLTLTGSIDRVDVMEKDGVKYAKVIDYKSGEKKFSRDDIYNGMSLQLPIYSYALESLLPDVRVSAMYYLKVGAPKPSLSAKGCDDSEYAELVNACFVRDGMFCRDDGVEDGFGLNVKKSGFFSRAKIREAVDYSIEKVREVGNRITAGNIEISPLTSKNGSVCATCKFSGICHIDALDDRAREFQTPPDDFLREDK